MKEKFMVLTFLFLSSLNAFSGVTAPLYNAANSIQGSGSYPNRTFTAKKIAKPNLNMNFESALFSITKSSVGLKANAPFYSLVFNGSIDIAPGGNKFWDLASNAEVIDEFDNQIETDVQATINFKDCSYTKACFLSVLGQSVKANEYYTITVDGVYAKGMSIVAQTVSGSGITVNVPAQEVLYSPSRLICNFPLTYGGAVHTVPQYNRTINATISGASALGIPIGTPVSYSVAFNDCYKVLAWGGLQLLDNEKPINALLVQSESKTVGTVYINGVKASQEVLSPLKLIQDAPETFTTYSFRDIAYPDNVAEFGLDGNKVTYLTSIKTVK